MRNVERSDASYIYSDILLFSAVPHVRYQLPHYTARKALGDGHAARIFHTRQGIELRMPHQNIGVVGSLANGPRDVVSSAHTECTLARWPRSRTTAAHSAGVAYPAPNTNSGSSPGALADANVSSGSTSSTSTGTLHDQAAI